MTILLSVDWGKLLFITRPRRDIAIGRVWQNLTEKKGEGIKPVPNHVIIANCCLRLTCNLLFTYRQGGRGLGGPVDDASMKFIYLILKILLPLVFYVIGNDHVNYHNLDNW